VVPARARALAAHAGRRPSAGGSRSRSLTRLHAYVVIAAASLIPRLVALLAERDDITSAFVDKGDDFALTFLDSGTYGFIPGIPSAYTQPLYGFFMIPLYWALDRHWLVIGLAHIVVAVATALLVYELGRRVTDRRVGLCAAVLWTLHPYLVWHDVHMNREILDQFLAVAAVLLTLVVAERGGLGWSALLGGVLGLMILGNVRTLFVGVVLGAYVLWRRRAWTWEPAIALAVGALVVAPWVLRNEANVGCVAITTDARALWKANNEHTLETLRNGGWIDDVPNIPGAPPTPQDAGELYKETGRIVRTDECAQMRFYRKRALDFIANHPGEKAKLAAEGTKLLWQPKVPKTEGRPGKDTPLDVARDWAEPLYMIPVFLLALYGLTLVPRHFAGLAVALLLYQTAMAMLFVGQTRYRVPWDFLLAVPAAAALVALWDRLRRRT
jgi:4-amino-4-deoxy-L-arabinose transferase-like glycosyltransferase